ncbi:Hypothetical protein J6890_00520 [Nakaseomyces glabratus]
MKIYDVIFGKTTPRSIFNRQSCSSPLPPLAHLRHLQLPPPSPRSRIIPLFRIPALLCFSASLLLLLSPLQSNSATMTYFCIGVRYDHMFYILIRMSCV